MYSKLELKIIKNLDTMGIAIDDAALKEYSNTEKEKLERLAERMSYLYDKVKNNTGSSANISFCKEEFRALEWVFYELGIIADGVKKVQF